MFCLSVRSDAVDRKSEHDDARRPLPTMRKVSRRPFRTESSLAELDDEVKPRVSRWIHDQCALGTVPKIATREIEFLRNLKPLPFEERANRVLLYIAKQTKVYGVPIRLFR